jgi:hypothetical protein
LSPPLVVIATPIVPLAVEQLRELRRDHLQRRFHLVPQKPQIGRGAALDGNPEALVHALLSLSIECLIIHSLAEADPHRPAGELLDAAVRETRSS